MLRDHPERPALKHVIKVQAPNYDDPAFDAAEFREGILTDKRKDRAKLPAGDPHLAATSDLAYRRFAALQHELGYEVCSWSDLAIKFSLAHPLFCSVIVSMNTVDQVESVLAAADGNYPDAAFVERVHGIVSRA